MRYFAAINTQLQSGFWHSQPAMRLAGIAYPSVIDSDCREQGTNIEGVLPAIRAILIYLRDRERG